MDTLAKHFRDLTRAAFARYGFAYAEVIARWPEIVGEEMARHSRPERIKWPRGAGEEARKTGGTLVIGAAPGRALDLQYEVPRIIERINRYYGYGAIVAVKVMQGQGVAPAPVHRPAQPKKDVSIPALAAIEDEGLKTALSRLGEAVAGQAQGSPQGK
jgi:hypothetical protein